MSTRETPLAQMLAVFRSLLYEVDPAARGMFLGAIGSTRGLRINYPEHATIIDQAVENSFGAGRNARKLVDLYRAYRVLAQEEQAKILEVLAQCGSAPASKLEDAFIVWAQGPED